MSSEKGSSREACAVVKEPKSRVKTSRKRKPCSDGGEFKRANVDIAIVGAGAAGLYVAWRLLSEPMSHTKSIALFDSADRVGGRIHSVIVPGVPYFTELGAMFTDLPIRQVYHFGSERQRQLSASGKLRSACLLLLFVDAQYADYWKRLDENTVLARIQDQLAQVAGKAVPAPIALVLKHWSDRPYHAGWHAWNVGARSWEIRDKLLRPFFHANLFTCGEAFSSEQGWIEGALKSAERVLESMGLPSPPSWVNKAEYDAQEELWT